jgi:NADH dehydrogenase
MCSSNVAAAVGTVQVRSLVEPLRKIIARLRGHFVVAKAVDLVMSERLLELETLTSTGESQRVYLPYVYCPTLIHIPNCHLQL